MADLGFNNVIEEDWSDEHRMINMDLAGGALQVVVIGELNRRNCRRQRGGAQDGGSRCNRLSAQVGAVAVSRTRTRTVPRH